MARSDGDDMGLVGESQESQIADQVQNLVAGHLIIKWSPSLLNMAFSHTTTPFARLAPRISPLSKR